MHQLALAQAIAQLALATPKLHSTSTSSTSTQLDLFVTLKCQDLNGSKWTPRGNWPFCHITDSFISQLTFYKLCPPYTVLGTYLEKYQKWYTKWTSRLTIQAPGEFGHWTQSEMQPSENFNNGGPSENSSSRIFLPSLPHATVIFPWERFPDPTLKAA